MVNQEGDSITRLKAQFYTKFAWVRFCEIFLLSTQIIRNISKYVLLLP